MIEFLNPVQKIMKPLSEEELWEFIDGEMPESEAARVRQILARCRQTRLKYRELLKAEKCILNAVNNYRYNAPLQAQAYPIETPLCPSQYIGLYRLKAFKPLSAGFGFIIVFFAGMLPFSLFNTDIGHLIFQTCEASLLFCFKTPLLYFSIFTLTVIWALFIFDKLFVRRNTY